jgi:hypothetical protein
VINDEESKRIAETDLEARKLVLEKRKEQMQMNSEESIEIEEAFVAPAKKWYQFWK